MRKQTIKQKIETLSNKWEQIWISQKGSGGNDRKTFRTSLASTRQDGEKVKQRPKKKTTIQVIIIIYTKDGMEFNAHVPRELCETAAPLINWKIWDI